MNELKLYEELKEWHRIGISDDIVYCPDQRPEYKKYVNIAKDRGIPNDKIPRFVLLYLCSINRHNMDNKLLNICAIILETTLSIKRKLLNVIRIMKIVRK